jgi:hypothetical protein
VTQAGDDLLNAVAAETVTWPYRDTAHIADLCPELQPNGYGASEGGIVWDGKLNLIKPRKTRGPARVLNHRRAVSHEDLRLVHCRRLARGALTRLDGWLRRSETGTPQDDDLSPLCRPVRAVEAETSRRVRVFHEVLSHERTAAVRIHREQAKARLRQGDADLLAHPRGGHHP